MTGIHVQEVRRKKISKQSCINLMKLSFRGKNAGPKIDCDSTQHQKNKEGSENVETHELCTITHS
jgi:hypothetical protein